MHKYLQALPNSIVCVVHCKLYIFHLSYIFLCIYKALNINKNMKYKIDEYNVYVVICDYKQQVFSNVFTMNSKDLSNSFPLLFSPHKGLTKQFWDLLKVSYLYIVYSYICIYIMYNFTETGNRAFKSPFPKKQSKKFLPYVFHFL